MEEREGGGRGEGATDEEEEEEEEDEESLFEKFEKFEKRTCLDSFVGAPPSASSMTAPSSGKRALRAPSTEGRRSVGARERAARRGRRACEAAERAARRAAEATEGEEARRSEVAGGGGRLERRRLTLAQVAAVARGDFCVSWSRREEEEESQEADFSNKVAREEAQ